MWVVTDDGWFFWAGNRFPAKLDERIGTARATGCTAMSLFPLDVRHAVAAGTTPTELAARASDAGIPVRVLDPFTKWLPTWPAPADLSDDDRAFLDVEEDEFLDWAEQLGVRSMTVIEPFGAPTPVEVATESFARICDTAAERGLNVHLEFLPWSGVPDLGTAWTIVRDAGRANGGLVLDSWHFFRSRSSLEQLATVPADRVFTVQIADGPATAADDLSRESTYGRLLPGAGDFDLAGLIRVLRESGVTAPVGPEVFSPPLWEEPPDTAGARLRDALRAFRTP